ncbi:MAG: hypothetical protein SFV23_24835 [Planctomycetaceae bacterium]|nr:hypothetical protein [Planctomycetaceae bacterium]
MTTASLFSVWTACVLAAVPAGTELKYTGKLEKAETQAAAVDKTFSLTVLVTAPGQFAFLVDERGGGGWNWPQRFGFVDRADDKAVGVRLLYDFEGSPTPLPVRQPFFEFMDRLTPNSQWTESGGQYSFLRDRMLNGRDVAVVEVTLDRGRRQQLQIERSSGLVAALEERLFLGRGDAFRLTMQLEGTRVVEPAELESAVKITRALFDLQEQLSPPDALHRSILTAAEIDRAQQVVTALGPVGDTTWGRLVTAIQRDLTVQSRRLEGVTGLEKKYLGQSAAVSGEWKRLDGQPLATSETLGHTTVLHFWEYGGEKLIEPYGQVGYLDFLNNRRGKLGVKVVGVAVDPRFADASQARAAARSIRKFQEFMNVSFPITVDDGTLLTKFGDPRTLGSELPLWVVVGHDGKIAHYKVGYYDLKPDEGLRELDAAVVEALKKEKAAARGQ